MSLSEENSKSSRSLTDSTSASFDSINIDDDIDFTGLPNEIFICKVSEKVFNDESLKKDFESLCQIFGNARFIYLPSFRRVRIAYDSSVEAGRAKLALHNTKYLDSVIEVYYVQSSSSNEIPTSSNLLPPAPQKQFLISPPASPPVGWEPVEENKPSFNFDLVSTLIEMTPGQSHELHKSDDGKPSVVVHVCENTDSDTAIRKIPQTKRPGT